MNHDYKNSGRCAKTERESRASTAIEIRNQKRNDMLQKKRTMAFVKGPSQYNISEMAEKINSTDIDKIVEGATEIRRLLSAEKCPPIDSIVMTGLTTVFGRLINPANPVFANIAEEKVIKVIHEASWVLTNISSGNNLQTMAVIKSGAVKHLVGLLLMNNEEIQDQGVWALGNIAGDCEAARDIVINAGATEPILALIKKQLDNPNRRADYLRNLSWALSNMNRGRSPPPTYQHMERCLEMISYLVSVDDPEVVSDAYWALSYICDAGIAQVDLVIGTGLIESTMERLASFQKNMPHGEHKMFSQFREQTISPIIRTLGNIATYEDKHTDYIIGLGLIGILKKIFSLPMDHRKSIRVKKEICWVISNITAGTPEQIDQVIKEGFLEILACALKNSDNLTKIEACWALCNASMHIDTHIHQVREVGRSGAIVAFSKFLPTVKNDAKIAKVILDCLSNLLECGRVDSLGGENHIAAEIEGSSLLDQIEELQAVDNYAVASTAEKIIRNYFDGQ
ncbi:importin subunit alpha-2 [Nematocida displodere]|uniref:Importin subunit alpha n=1 Tax=Nematocida displodere TaxID=1805483 RepID=A0A177EJN1_9MICR|nr:importin subunit alpha-2 [Nematocida displodere]